MPQKINNQACKLTPKWLTHYNISSAFKIPWTSTCSSSGLTMIFCISPQNGPLLKCTPLVTKNNHQACKLTNAELLYYNFPVLRINNQILHLSSKWTSTKIYIFCRKNLSSSLQTTPTSFVYLYFASGLLSFLQKSSLRKWLLLKCMPFCA